MVPRKINDLQMKLPLLADGSLDPASFEEEVALIAHENSLAELPYMAGTRGSNSTGSPVWINRDSGAPTPVYAYGRVYMPVSYADFGPRHHHLHTAAEAAAKIEKLVPNLQTIHGDALGLAYWKSVCDFVGDGGGEEAASYVTTVMDHLTSGGQTTVRDTLGYLADRGASELVSGGAPRKGGLSLPTLAGIVDWLEHRPVRDRMFTQRIQALTCPMYLRDLSPRSMVGSAASSDEQLQERPAVSDAEKRRLFEKTSHSLKHAYEHGRSSDAQELEGIAEDIYTLAEQMCWSMTGSRKPAARLPALMRVPAPSSSSNARPPVVGARPPMPSRTMSTPALSGLNSASLATAVRSDMMMSNLIDVAESEYH
ncbi:hypothetical protein GGI21_005297 [Coemansia aciculifera]|nr:hypothetical protein GGI21_005297 [Coemansia aciculifera]